jgi:hypothetical protein
VFFAILIFKRFFLFVLCIVEIVVEVSKKYNCKVNRSKDAAAKKKGLTCSAFVVNFKVAKVC